MEVVNFIFCGIFITMYTAGWFFTKFRQYIKKNIWLDNLPGVLELIFLLNFSEYLFVEQWNWEYGEILFLGYFNSYQFGNLLLVG